MARLRGMQSGDPIKNERPSSFWSEAPLFFYLILSWRLIHTLVHACREFPGLMWCARLMPAQMYSLPCCLQIILANIPSFPVWSSSWTAIYRNGRSSDSPIVPWNDGNAVVVEIVWNRNTGAGVLSQSPPPRGSSSAREIALSIVRPTGPSWDVPFQFMHCTYL